MSEPQTIPRGTLILIGTPIGNLGDLSHRVVDVLSRVDLIAAEDTRRTRQLLSYLGLHQPLTSYHEHNQDSKGPQLVEKLREGQTIALVSDAGMPCISDPGEGLVGLCIDANVPILVIPGPSAAVTALAGSGLESDRFAFEGFLPSDKKLRRERLAELNREPRTMVLYEAPHRLKKALQELATAGFQERRLVLGRELTKKHEEFLRGTVQGLLEYYEQNDPRGEYVLVLEGRRAYLKRVPPPSDGSSGGANERGDDIDFASDQPKEILAETMLKELLSQGVSVREAAKETALRTGLKKNELYARALELNVQK
ncbi:MAG: 16S rRNA (cytidine(1402)-2'-O)-methyltransferase [Eubacteriales bacterium]|nr:16S rRNA (cytidine(1402)-2'-O)-methyltransferase [Eubacteriales bacterium]